MSYKNGKNRKFFLDMDGVAFDFAGARDALGMTSEQFKMMRGAYRDLKPYPGVVENVLKLIETGWDVWVATKIPDLNPYAATEKLLCINEHMPFLSKSVIITPNKGTLGNEHSFLLDDRPHKAHCDEFEGRLLTYGFDNEYKNWDEVMAKMAKHCPDGDIMFEITFGTHFVPVRADGHRLECRMSEIPLEFREDFRAFLRPSVAESTLGDHVTLHPDLIYNYLQKR